MSLRSNRWIPPFGPTSTLIVSPFPGPFRRLSTAAPLSNFCHSYQNALRIVIWLFFLFVYSQAGTSLLLCSRRSSEIVRTVREPLDRLAPLHHHVETWEFILYVNALAFALQGAPIPCP